jgi:hypothetical protein
MPASFSGEMVGNLLSSLRITNEVHRGIEDAVEEAAGLFASSQLIGRIDQWRPSLTQGGKQTITAILLGKLYLAERGT